MTAFETFEIWLETDVDGVLIWGSLCSLDPLASLVENGLFL